MAKYREIHQDYLHFLRATTALAMWKSGGEMGAENLIQNGNFERDLSGWLSTGGTFVHSANRSLFGQGSAQKTLDGARLYQDISIPNGHKVYIRGNCYIVTTSNQPLLIGYDYGGTSSGVIGYFDLAVANAWQMRSVIKTAANGGVRVSFGGTYAAVACEYYMDGLMLIDLTVMFGAGREPSLAFCDAYFATYFEGKRKDTRWHRQITPPHVARWMPAENGTGLMVEEGTTNLPITEGWANVPNATVDGLVAEYDMAFDLTNLIKWSEDFSTSSWTKNNLTPRANVGVAPDGTLSATKLTASVDAEAVTHSIYQSAFSLEVGADYHSLVAVKVIGPYPWFRVTDPSSGGGAYVNSITGEIGSTTAGFIPSVTALGNGWYSVGIKRAVHVNTFGVLIGVAGGDGISTCQCNGEDVLLIWHPQVNKGAIPLPYVKTTNGQTLPDVAIPPKAVPNIVQNGNFANGVVGWLSAAANPATASNNTATVTGNGSSSVIQFYRITSTPWVSGGKVYARAKAKVTNNVCSSLRLYIEGSTGGVYVAQEQTSPVQDQQYTLSGICSNSGHTGNVLINIREVYADAATALGKVMELQEYFAIDLTALYGAGNEPTKEQCDVIFAEWFDGTKTMNISKFRGTLGSTASVDANDPTPNGQGLSNGADDYTQLPVSIDINADFTALVVAEVTTAAPSAYEYLLGFGNSANNNPLGGIRRLNTGEMGAVLLNDAAASATANIAATDVFSGNRMLVWKRSGANMTILDVSSGKSATIACPASPVTINRITLGALGRVSYGGYYPHPFYHLALYKRALTTQELQRELRRIRAKLAARGVQVGPPTDLPQRSKITGEYWLNDALGNIMPTGSEGFVTGWVAYSGATVTVEQGYPDPDGGNNAVRIRTSGGTNVLKYLCNVTTSVSGQTYPTGIRIKNLGAASVNILQNIGTVQQTIPTGDWTSIVLTGGVGNGSWGVQTCIRTVSVDDSLDFLAYQPQVNLGAVLKPYAKPTGLPQTVKDYSGKGNHGTLGSSVSADANDPQWAHYGLANGADDFAQIPHSININNDFAVYVVAEVTAEFPAMSEVLFSFGSSTSSTQFLDFYRSTAGNLNVYASNDAGVGLTSGVIAAGDVVSGIRLLMLKKTSAGVTIRDLVTGKSATASALSGVYTFNKCTLGALGRVAYSSSYPHGINACILYKDYVPTEAEDQQILDYIRHKLLTERGLVI